MAQTVELRRKRKFKSIKYFIEGFLDPIDWLSETIFSILIVLVFTLAYRIFAISSSAGGGGSSESTFKILIAILGAVLAWSFIDGVIYAVLSIFDREDKVRILRKILATESEPEKIEVIADEFEVLFESITDEPQRDDLYRAIAKAASASPRQKNGLKREDIWAAVSHVLIALIVVIPSLIPLILFNGNLVLAIRISNLVSFGMLFITGYLWGKYTGVNPIRTGIIIMAIAIVLALLAIPLGG